LKITAVGDNHSNHQKFNENTCNKHRSVPMGMACGLDNDKYAKFFLR